MTDPAMNFKRIDDRRNKSYALVVTQQIRLPSRARATPLEDALFPLDRPLRPKVEFAHGWEQGSPSDDGTDSWNLVWRFKADKPSAILSEEAAIELLSPVQEMIDAGIRACAAAVKQSTYRAKVTDQTNHLALWYGKAAVRRAKAAVRLDQRLAALHAEMDAEVKVQLAALPKDAALASQVDAGTYKEEPYDPVAREAALRLADKYAGYKPMVGFFEGNGRDISEADVFGEDETETSD